MRKKIYTANEEMNGVGSSLLFSIIWYLSLIRYILLYGFEVSLLIFLVAGILVPAQAIRTIQRARYYRKFKSEPYRIPVYKYLATPYVQVYTDRTGWKQVIDGFQLKSHRNEPDIPLENSNVYLTIFSKNSPILLGGWDEL